MHLLIILCGDNYAQFISQDVSGMVPAVGVEHNWKMWKNRYYITRTPFGHLWATETLPHHCGTRPVFFVVGVAWSTGNCQPGFLYMSGKQTASGVPLSLKCWIKVTMLRRWGTTPQSWYSIASNPLILKLGQGITSLAVIYIISRPIMLM